MFDLLFYLFVLAGSVSWGYLILRLSWPDVRVSDSTWKIGSSSIIGFILTIFSIILSIPFGAAFFSTIFFSSALLGFFSLRTYSQMRTINTIKVAIPFGKGEEIVPEIGEMEFKPAFEFKKPLVETEKEKTTPVPPVQPIETIDVPKAEKTTEKKKGIFDTILSNVMVPKAKDVELLEVDESKITPIDIAVPEKVQAEEHKEETKEVLEKAKEFELEKEVQDIFVDVQDKKVPVQQESQAQTSRRRMWARPLSEQQQKVTQQQDEIKSMVSDIYVQLKKGGEEKTGASALIPSGAKVEKPKEEKEEPKEEKPPEEKKEKSILDMLTETKEEEKPVAPAEGDIFSQLQGMAGGEQKTESKFIDLPAKEKMGCPTCSTRGVKVAFCPYCGTGFCANCSPSVDVGPESITYTCPKCGETVDVKKK